MKDPYAQGKEENLIEFLDKIRFLCPSCGEHVHFQYSTISFSDGSNLLINKISTDGYYVASVKLALFDSLTNTLYVYVFGKESYLNLPMKKDVLLSFVDSNTLGELAKKKEFTDEFRRRLAVEG